MSAGGQLLISANQLRQLVTTKLQYSECVSLSCRQRKMAIGVLVGFLQELQSINDTQGRVLEELIQRLNSVYRTTGQISRFSAPANLKTANSKIAQELMAQLVKMNLVSADKIWSSAFELPSYSSTINMQSKLLQNGGDRCIDIGANSRGQKVGYSPRITNGLPSSADDAGTKASGALPVSNVNGTAAATTSVGRPLPVNGALRGNIPRHLSDSTKSKAGQPVNGITAANGRGRDSMTAMSKSNNKRSSKDESSACSSTKRFCIPSMSGGSTTLIETSAPLLVNGKSPVISKPDGRPITGLSASLAPNAQNLVSMPTNGPVLLCVTTGFSTPKSTFGTLNGSHLTAKKTKSRSASGVLNGLKEPTICWTATPMDTTNGKLHAVSSLFSASQLPGLLLSPLTGKDGLCWSITGERVTLRPPSFSSQILNLSIDPKAAPRLNHIVIMSDETGKVEFKLNYEVKSVQQKLYMYYYLTSRSDDAWLLGQVFNGTPSGFMQMSMQFKDLTDKGCISDDFLGAKPDELLWATFRMASTDPLAISDVIHPIVVPLNGSRRILRLHWDDQSGEYRRWLNANVETIATPIDLGQFNGPTLQSGANVKVGESAAATPVEIIQLD